MQPILAEVIESSTRHFVAEVWPEREVPEFGSWVEVERRDGVTLFGLVSHAETGSIEPGRRATAFGRSRDELKREMPHVLELLRTVFRAQVLAYREPGGPVRQTLPPRPAELHDLVRSCDTQVVCGLGQPFDFLRTLSHGSDPGVPVDDLLVAVLRQLYRASGRGREGERALLEAGRALSHLLEEDHQRLHSILRRVP